MNDFEPRAILEATADVMREQRQELLEQIEGLKQAVADSDDKVESLRSELIHADEAAAAKLQDTYSKASKQYYALQVELSELRGQLARMPQDPSAVVAELKGRVDQIEKTPGPAGKDADPEDVARSLLLSERFLALIREIEGPEGPVGKTGARGPAGPPPDLDLLAARVKGDPVFQENVRGARGPAGESPTPEEVSSRLAQNVTFLKLVEGKPGRDGKDGAPADPVAVAKALAENSDFRALFRGEKGDTGEKGEKGDPGEPGPAANALDVAERLKSDAEFLTKIRPNLEEMVKLATEELKRCNEFLRKVTPKDGADGAGVLAPYYQPGAAYREGAIVQTAFGKLYQATCDTAQNPRGSDHWKRLGFFGFEWMGIKNDKRTYEPGDFYIDQGSAFLVLPDGRPKMFSQRGAQGRQGDPGKDGKDGRDGATAVACVLQDDAFRFGLDDGTSFDVDISDILRALKEAATASAQKAALEEAEHQRRELECDEDTIMFTCHRGTWSVGKTYRRGDAVTFNSALWLCKREHESGQNMSSSYWRRLAVA